MKTYLSVLAKVARPSRTPSFQHAQILLQQDDIGRLFGDIHGIGTEMPTSAACRAEASLIPSPM